MLKTAGLFALLGALLFGLACGNDDDGDSVATPAATIAEGAEQERDDFLDDAESRLEQLREDLEQLRDDVSDGDAGQALEDRVDDVQQRIDDAEQRIEDARDASDDEWQQLRSDVEDALQSAGDLIEEVVGELTSS